MRHHTTGSQAEYELEYDSGFTDRIDNIDPPDCAGTAYLDGWTAANELAGFAPLEWLRMNAESKEDSRWPNVSVLAAR